MKKKGPAKTNEQFGLKKNSFPKHKQWAVDQDYVKDLDPATADWLGKFNQEFYRNRVTKGSTTDLHSTDTLRKDCYSRENAANRDLFAVKNVGNMVDAFSISDEDGNEIDAMDLIADITNPHEDQLINRIDQEKK